MPTCFTRKMESSDLSVGSRAMLLTPVLLLVLSASVHADSLFLAPLSVDAGSAPAAVAIADLNADGQPDLAVTAVGSSSVSVLLGNGDGTFAARTEFGTGYEPFSLAIADLNADGRPDLAVANYQESTVSVLLGNGDGTFLTRMDFVTGGAPARVAISDLNADGRPDLAVMCVIPGAISVLLGHGDGTFGTHTQYAAGVGSGSGRAYSLAIADLNADGRPDLAVAVYAGNRIAVMLGNGDGTFGARTDISTEGRPYFVAIADLNADGRPDLAVANYASNTVSVLLGNGDGSFGARTDFGTGTHPMYVAIADLDADGRPDLALTNFGSNTVSVLLGSGDGTFGANTEYVTGIAPTSVAIADLNADGWRDLAVTNYGLNPANIDPNAVSVFLNRGATPAPIAMGFEFTPHTLNLESRGRWVTGFLEPPAPLAARDIDISSIRLNRTVPVDLAAPTTLGDHNDNGIPDLMLRFNRVAVELTVSAGENVPVTVTGTLAGRAFLGRDSIRVRRSTLLDPAGGSQLMAGSVAPVRWQMANGVTVQSVSLLYSLDGGRTWHLIAGGQPNTGSFDWTVPNVQTDQAKVALVSGESTGVTGDLGDSVLGVSDAFSIVAVTGVEHGGPGQFVLAIRGTTPNPAAGDRVWVEFALRDESPARLELLDVAGRVLTSKQVGKLGPGDHALDLSEGNAPRPGIYFLRLTQGGAEVRARAVFVR